jgi:hypothetical protein
MISYFKRFQIFLRDRDLLSRYALSYFWPHKHIDRHQHLTVDVVLLFD